MALNSAIAKQVAQTISNSLGVNEKKVIDNWEIVVKAIFDAIVANAQINVSVNVNGAGLIAPNGSVTGVASGTGMGTIT